jgi:hypothetical protein
MITILNRPYDNLTTKINPVYNGLGFVVTSDKRLLPNFKYIAEIYVSGGKIGELKHNPDISANNYGIFDVGRIIENYLSYDLNPKVNYSTLSNMSKSLIPYYVRFGEEFTRVCTLASLGSYSGGTYTGKLRVQTEYAHNLETGDRVLIQGTSLNSYNTWSRVYKLNSFSFVAYDITYTTPANVSDGYIIQGETIDLWQSYLGPDGANYLQITVKGNTTLRKGDMIEVRQDRTNQSNVSIAVINPQYENSEWTITDIISSGTKKVLKTNIPYGAVVATNIFGSVISRNNFILYNLSSTQNDTSLAWNGVRQWDDILNWTPSQYIFTTPTSKFLTKNPNKQLDVCINDYFTLPYWGRDVIKTIDSLNINSNRIRLETFSQPPSPASYVASSIASDSTITSARLILQFNGQLLTSTYTQGSLITFNHSLGSLNGKILRSYTSSGNTLVITDIAYAAFTGPYSLVVTTQVRQYDRPLGALMAQFGCGPKNLNLTEVLNGLCYQYKVYPIKYTSTTNLYTPTIEGDIWTFNITDCNCKPNIKLMWLNELGGIDYFTLDGRIDKSRNIEKSNFRRKLKSYKSGNGYTFNYGERGLTTYNTKSDDAYVARTKFLTQSELDWLSYIYESPEVYILKDNGDMIPITITNTDISLPSKDNVGDMGRLYYYTIEFVYSNDRVVQRG